MTSGGQLSNMRIRTTKVHIVMLMQIRKSIIIFCCSLTLLCITLENSSAVIVCIL